MNNIEQLLKELKEKSSKQSAFITRCNSNILYNDIIDYLKSKYVNITEDMPSKFYLSLYYQNIYLDYVLPKCPYCNNIRKYIKNLNFRETCCSVECNTKLLKDNSISGNKEVIEKRRETWLKKYGVGCPFSSNIVKEKIKQTNLEKYGVEYYSQLDEHKNNIRNNFQNEEFKEKSKNTCLKKYGVEHYTQSNEYKNRVKDSNIKKYGVENPMQNEEIKQKAKETNIRKYGVEHYTQTEEYRNKMKLYFRELRNKKYKNLILDNDLKLINISGDVYKCEVCENTFNVREEFIKKRLLYSINFVCPYCYPKDNQHTSNNEKLLYEYIQNICDEEIVYRYKENNTEIDIYIPFLKIGFEFNGLYWHSEIHRDKYYHRDKTLYFGKQGIRLIHIWEDDWLYKNEIVKSRIRNLLGKTEKRVYGRNTEVKEISYQDCKQFLDENHIQGVGVGNIRYGLFYKDDLVSVIQIDSNGLLSRFANKLNTNVIGGFSKLFKYCENYIKYTFIDLDWSSTDDNIYSRYMKFDSYVEPTWYLLYKGKRVHRRNFQKKKLLQMGMGRVEQTEHEITLQNKLYRIYNSGNIKYVKKEEL